MDLLSRRDILKGILASPAVRSAIDGLFPGSVDHLEPTLLKVTVPVRGLDRRLDGLRIAQISDTHIGGSLDVNYLHRALQLLRPRPPELLMMTGDLLDDQRLLGACLDVIGAVPAPFGSYFIMGNHDNYAGRDSVIAGARAHPTVKFLLNDELDVEVQGAKVHLIGLDYSLNEKLQLAWSARPVPHVAYRRVFPEMTAQVLAATERKDEGDLRVCLAHHPDYFDALKERGIELTLSGHTHGGQVAPIGTALAKDSFHYVRGLYEDGGNHVYVNAGTGYWFPLRVGVPAEVTELTLIRV